MIHIASGLDLGNCEPQVLEKFFSESPEVKILRMFRKVMFNYVCEEIPTQVEYADTLTEPSYSFVEDEKMAEPDESDEPLFDNYQEYRPSKPKEKLSSTYHIESNVCSIQIHSNICDNQDGQANLSLLAQE